MTMEQPTCSSAAAPRQKTEDADSAIPPNFAPDLRALIDGITPDNRHEEVSFGIAVGQESF